MCDVTAGVRSTAVQTVWTHGDNTAAQETQTAHRRRQNTGHFDGRIAAAGEEII